MSAPAKLTEPVRRDFRVALPSADGRIEQDSEWCVVRVDGQWREIRFHDYHDIYGRPGLYEYLFHDVLECSSPATVCELLETEVRRARQDPKGLRVLDLGAGNGLVGAELADRGVEMIVGVDIIPEAAEAAARDRPGVYRSYRVLDMCRLAEKQRQSLVELDLNALTCVAALGFGDIPARAFAESFNLVAPQGWIAFNLKEDFLKRGDSSGFGSLVQQMIRDGTLRLEGRLRYPHRRATNGDWIYYVAIVGRKRRDLDVP